MNAKYLPGPIGRFRLTSAATILLPIIIALCPRATGQTSTEVFIAEPAATPVPAASPTASPETSTGEENPGTTPDPSSDGKTKVSWRLLAIPLLADVDIEARKQAFKDTLELDEAQAAVINEAIDIQAGIYEENGRSGRNGWSISPKDAKGINRDFGRKVRDTLGPTQLETWNRLRISTSVPSEVIPE